MNTAVRADAMGRTQNATPAPARAAFRPVLGLFHRWVGLLIAGFLFFSGVTGAVISWDHELDELLNPHLMEAKSVGQQKSTFDLAQQIEDHHPTMQVTYIPFVAEEGHSLSFGVEPRENPATGRLHEDTFNEVFMDPVSGAELGKREWGAVWPITTETFVSFLYVLHYSLHLPEMWGIHDWGVWLMGVIALLWTFDCFVGFYLTLPARSRGHSRDSSKSFWNRWKPSWLVRTQGGAYKLNFDLHRAGGLWTWGLLFIVAFTAVSMNLYREVFFPVMSMVSDVTPSPFDLREPHDHDDPITPSLGFAEIVSRAETEARSRGWQKPVGDAFYSREYGIYGVSFFLPEDGHGAGGVGHPQLYLDALSGQVLGDHQPWKGTFADIFVQAQFPLHSGRILGIPGRILISLMGLVVAGLSVTGVYIWWRKRQSLRAASARQSV